MYHISRKYKQFWFFILKLTFVVGAGYYIYQHTFENVDLQFMDFSKQLEGFLFQPIWYLPVVFLFSILNWLLEIRKWQVLVQSLRPISFLESAKHSLSTHTLSLVTPFKAGEYAGKALYFSKSYRGRVLALNLAGNLSQLIITILLGTMGFVYFYTHFDLPLSFFKLRKLAYLFALFIGFFFIGNQFLKNNKFWFLHKMKASFLALSSALKWRLLILSALRYLVFSHQFYFLLLVFQVQVSYDTALFLIFFMYFIATMLPAMSLFDFVIKGSVAIFLFTFVGADELKILTISSLMWLLNFALPAMIGSVLLLLPSKIE